MTHLPNLARRHFLKTAGAAATAIGVGILTGSALAQTPRVLVDWHSHYLSDAELNFLATRTTAPRLVRNTDGVAQIDNVATASGAGLAFTGVARSNIEARLKQLDDNGIQRQLLSQTIPLGFDATLSIEDQRKLYRAYNDELAQVLVRYPGRFLAVAALPSGDPLWAGEELKRAHKELGFIGGSLPLNAFITLKSARTLAPLFAEAQKLNSHFLIHRGPASDRLPDQPAVIIPEDTAFARWGLINGTHLTAGGITLGLTDFLDPYPDVSIEIVMLAGYLPHLLDTWITAGRNNGIADPLARLRRLYLDTGPYSRNGEWVTQAVRKLGADRILFGTDYGVGGGDRGDIGPSLTTLDIALTQDERRRIYIENSRNLLKTKGITV
ncbi:amidohydrolase family protein [Asticcacaulis tiandongensis]|uniref:amidohydrolase family protein n=1 Tax=Asticcacaulis tiandongensis TaxID=2565365 RepID=UPI00112A437E|nr:amidohydrolase family protein [Asticcacaulis tiandongensis]